MLEKDDALEAKKRFSSLKRVILIYFIKDEFVIPPTSAKFDEYKDGKVIDLVETDFYKKDLIGIRKLKEDNKLSIISVDSYHTIDENCQKILVEELKIKDQQSKISVSAFIKSKNKVKNKLD